MKHSSEKINILINLTSSKSGGAINYIKNLIPLLYKKFQSNSKYRLFILTTEFQIQYINDIENINLIKIEDKIDNGFERYLWELKNLKGLICKYNVGIIFTPYQLTSIIKGIENIVMLRNMEPFNFNAKDYKYSTKSFIRNFLLRKLSNHTLKRADKIVAVSNYAKSYLTENLQINEKKIFTIYHGIPNTENIIFNKDLSYQIPKKFLFTCGSIIPYRRLEDIVKAFDKVVNKIDPNIFLLIAGAEIDQKYARKIKRLIDHSTSPFRIKFLGSIKWEKIIYLFKKSKLCIFATEIEACPNIALEAMSCGCKIISTDNEPLPEILKNSAIYYPSRDVEELSKLILKNHDIDSGINKIAIKNSKRYSWQKCALETFNMIIK